MRPHRLSVLLIAACAAALLNLGGCREKGPAEKAGEKIDEAVDKVGDAIDPKGPAEKVGEKIDDAVD